MKKTVRKITVLVVAVLMLSTIISSAVHADVGGVVKEFFDGNRGKTYAMPITKPAHNYENWIGFNAIGGEVRTSNKNVISVVTLYEDYKGVRLDGFRMTPVGVGTSKITVTYKYYTDKYNHTGTEETSYTIRTYKWTNPFATLKIGKKNFKKAFKKTDEKTIKPVKGRLKIKMNRKYKLSKVLYQANGSDSWKKIGKKSKVKLNHGDKLRFQFRDNKHHVSNATATFTIG